jgi:hypothetical protein
LEKNNHKKRAGGVDQDVDPEFKPQYKKKKKGWKNFLQRVNSRDPQD